MKELLAFLLMALCSVTFIACDESVAEAVEEEKEISEGWENENEGEDNQNSPVLKIIEDMDGTVAGDRFDQSVLREHGIDKVTNRLAANLMSKLCGGNDNRNYLISPLSIQMVVSMLCNGMDDAGKSQVLNAYGLCLDDMPMLNQYNRVLLARSKSAGHGTTIELANSVWMEYSYPVYRSFLEECLASYDAETFGMDRKDKDAGARINEWCNRKTHGTIPVVVSDGPVDSPLAIINAIYLNASWTSCFFEQMTKKSDFMNQDGTSSVVDMMKSTGYYTVSSSQNYDAISIPLGENEDMSFVVALPKDGYSADDLLRDGNSFLGDVAKTGEEQYVALELPKFRIEQNLSVNTLLADAGFKVLFDAETQYTGITPESFIRPNLLHKSFLDVNEKGVVASAVTLMTETSIGDVVVPSPFCINRPFVFYIYDKQLDIILFSGIINNL